VPIIADARLRPPADPAKQLQPCRAEDPEKFFPEPSDGMAIAAAKAVCGSCSVRLTCLGFALDKDDNQNGIFGGLTPAERRQMLRANPRIESWMDHLAGIEQAEQAVTAGVAA
jgi:hypothetical protein